MKTTFVQLAVDQARECMTVQLATSAKELAVIQNNTGTATMSKDALKLALEALERLALPKNADDIFRRAITAIKEALAQPEYDYKDLYEKEKRKSAMWLAKYEEIAGPAPKAIPMAQPEQEPVAWISVKDNLPKAVRGVSYKQSLTDVVLVRHSDRPDYPITAHAVVGEGLGAGVAIPTDGASEHPEIAWYSASSNLNNPFDLKNDDYERYLPKVFGSKITHWKPIDTSPPPQRKPLTDEEIKMMIPDGQEWKYGVGFSEAIEFARAIEAAHGIKENT